MDINAKVSHVLANPHDVGSVLDDAKALGGGVLANLLQQLLNQITSNPALLNAVVQWIISQITGGNTPKPGPVA